MHWDLQIEIPIEEVSLSSALQEKKNQTYEKIS